MKRFIKIAQSIIRYTLPAGGAFVWFAGLIVIANYVDMEFVMYILAALIALAWIVVPLVLLPTIMMRVRGKGVLTRVGSPLGAPAAARAASDSYKVVGG